MNRNSSSNASNLINNSQKLIRFVINKKDLEARTKQIEQSLQPLINQILTPDPNFSSHLLKGRSKNAHHLVEYLKKSILEFLEKSCEISAEYPDVKSEIDAEIENVKQKGARVIDASNAFAHEPYSSHFRRQMGNASNDLLKAVGRLLAIADMIEEYHLNQLILVIETDISNMKESTKFEEFVRNFISYSHNLKTLVGISDKLVRNIKDPNLKDDFVASRAKLNKQALLLFTAAKTAFNLPQSDLAKSLKDEQFNEATNALQAIKEIIINLQNMNDQFNHTKTDNKINQPKVNILDLLTSIDKQVNDLDPIKSNESNYQIKLEKQLDTIIQKISSSLTGPNGLDLISTKRKNKINDECKQLLGALGDLFESYKKNETDEINKYKLAYLKKSKSLRKKILKSIADQFGSSDRFYLPIYKLVHAAQNSNNQDELAKHVAIFNNETNYLFDLCNLACSISNNTEGIEHVELVMNRLRYLLPFVIKSAYVLCSFKNSQEAKINMETFKNYWLNELKLLILAVDDITLINEFLYVCEHELFIDLNRSIKALNERDLDTFDEFTQRVISRTNRICDVVQYEMNNYEPCEFTNKVYQQVAIIRNQILRNFQQSTNNNMLAIKTTPDQLADENEFIDSARLIYDIVRELRKALLLIPSHDDPYGGVDIDEEYLLQQETMSETNAENNQNENNNNNNENKNIDINNNNNNSINITEDNDSNNTSKLNDELSNYDFDNLDAEEPINAEQMTEAQKEEFYQNLNSFRQEKHIFDREVLKWDDKSNDIIVLSKEMCVIMMDMTNFTRNKGPYKTIPDIIAAAKKISIIGSKLEKLVRELASQCPESQTKRDLLGYLNLIPLFCNQLNIGSKVKENIIDPDSASSLIISSKNLMNTVISVVKASYVASTKYTNKTDNKKPIVQWKMKPPELKPLINIVKSNEISGLIRKGSQRHKYNPIKALSEFEI